MSKFIELSDYDASIHREILDALTREDDAVVEICEDRAVAEMRCYLSRRFKRYLYQPNASRDALRKH